MAPESYMDALNRLVNESFGDVLGRRSGGQVRYRYWQLKKGEHGNRFETWFAYGVNRSLGLAGGGTSGWWSWVWVWKGRVAHVQRAARSATRRKAKARAYRLFATAKGYADTTLHTRIAPRLTPEQRAAMERNLTPDPTPTPNTEGA